VPDGKWSHSLVAGNFTGAVILAEMIKLLGLDYEKVRLWESEVMIKL